VNGGRKTVTMRCVLLVVLIPLLGVTAGCATFTTADGVTYHLVIGFGLIRTKSADNAAVVATDAQSLGLVVSDRPGLKLGIGYAASTVVTVPPEAEDVRVEVSRQPFGPFVVEAPAVKLKCGALNQPHQ
jgi:hypothetical protein